jgi:hypothetical protein
MASSLCPQKIRPGGRGQAAEGPSAAFVLIPARSAAPRPESGGRNTPPCSRPFAGQAAVLQHHRARGQAPPQPQQIPQVGLHGRGVAPQTGSTSRTSGLRHRPAPSAALHASHTQAVRPTEAKNAIRPSSSSIHPHHLGTVYAPRRSGVPVFRRAGVPVSLRVQDHFFALGAVPHRAGRPEKRPSAAPQRHGFRLSPPAQELPGDDVSLLQHTAAPGAALRRSGGRAAHRLSPSAAMMASSRARICAFMGPSSRWS